MNGRYISLTVFLSTIVCVAACDSDEVTKLATKTAKNVLTQTWVAIEPIQCLGNPWEQDWLDNNNGEYDAYPKDPTTPGLEPEELEIIKDYYQRQGVEVSDGLNAPKFENVCLACSCPEGHTLFLQVREEDVATMVSLGYRLESPPRV